MNRYIRDKARRRRRMRRDRAYERPMQHYHTTSYPIYEDHRRYEMDHTSADYTPEEYDLADEWERDLEHWHDHLKHKDRFGLHKDQLLHTAKQMGVDFHHYNEKEFLTTYYMLVSDFHKISNDPHMYLTMAKEWLEDEDSALKGSDRLCAYYYEIVKGGED